MLSVAATLQKKLLGNIETFLINNFVTQKSVYVLNILPNKMIRLVYTYLPTYTIHTYLMVLYSSSYLCIEYVHSI